MKNYLLGTKWSEGAVGRYAISIALIGGAVLLRWVLDAQLGRNFGFMTMFGAVAVSVRLCGWGPAIVTAVGGFAAIAVIFIAPKNVFPATPGVIIATLIGYGISMALIIWMGAELRAARAQAEQRGENLERELIARKLIEETLRRRREELEVILDGAPAYILMAEDPQCIKVTGNSVALELFGLGDKRTAFERSMDHDISPVRYFDANGRELSWDELPMNQAASTGRAVENVELELRLADGRKVWIAGNAAPVFDREKKVRGVICAFIDRTDRKKAEESRERSQREAAERTAELQALLDAAPIAVWIAHDPKCHLITGNSYADEIVMQTERGRNVSQSALDQSGVRYRVLRNGITLAPSELPAQRATSTGRPVMNEELELIFPDGRSVHLLQSAAPLFDAAGRVRGCIVAAADVTQSRQAQRKLEEAHRLLENRAAQLEELVQQRTVKLQEMVSELECFAYRVALDLRAPLISIQASAKSLAENSSGVDSLGTNYARQIATAAEAMDDLIQDVLKFSRLMQSDLEIEPVNLAEILQSCLAGHPSLQPPYADVELAGAFPIVRGNKSEVRQCVLNLLRNAVKFVAPGQKAVVRVWSEETSGRVRLLFKDNGIGIDKSSIGRVFELFQRFHKGYEGSGIGLSLVKRATERMGGSVGVASEPGAGSVFWIELNSAMR